MIKTSYCDDVVMMCLVMLGRAASPGQVPWHGQTEGRPAVVHQGVHTDVEIIENAGHQ